MMHRALCTTRCLFVLVANLMLIQGCGEPPAQGEPILLSGSKTPCSDVERAIAWWQGRSAAACDDVEFRNLTPLGDGRLLLWSPETGNSDVWFVDRQGRMGSQPELRFIDTRAAGSRSLARLDEDTMVAFDQATSVVQIFRTNLDVADHVSIFTQVGKLSWPPVLGGRTLVHLEDGLIMDVEQGTGAYRAIQLAPAIADAVEATEVLGSRPSFRRGHRLMSIGSGRLIEWFPPQRDYRIWRYDPTRLPGDIFDAEPSAHGSWPELTHDQEVAVLDSDRAVVWDRSAGTMDVRKLDASRESPIAEKSLRVNDDDRFQSLVPPLQPATRSKIERLVVLFQYDRSFDSYLGRYCLAPRASGPTCQQGPHCCEAMPTELEGVSCEGMGSDTADVTPDASVTCLLSKMDAWAAGKLFDSSDCTNSSDFRCSDTSSPDEPAAAYARLAKRGLVADHYFSSAPDTWEANMLYFVTASYVPQIAGSSAVTIARLLADAGVPFALYLTDLAAVAGQSPPHFIDGQWAHFRALEEFAYDVASEQLPPISILVPPQNESGQPGTATALADVSLTESVVSTVQEADVYRERTLTLATYLTSGGYYDHAQVPAALECDSLGVGLGPRVPFLAFGPFVGENRVTHTVMEHTSITAFIEWNWLDGAVGALAGRDSCTGDLRTMLLPGTY